MHPTIIQIGDFRLATYGVLVAAGYLIGILWLGAQREKMGLSEERFWTLIYVLFFWRDRRRQDSLLERGVALHRIRGPPPHPGFSLRVCVLRGIYGNGGGGVALSPPREV